MSSTSPKHCYAEDGGCAAHYEVEIYEAVDSPTSIQIGIKARDWSFRFALASPDDVSRILSFLREYTGQLVFAEMVAGSFYGTPVRLIKDNEFADRFWLRASGGGDMVEFVFTANSLTEFTNAVTQAVDDFQG